MYRALPYMLLFAAVVLLQALLFDNLTLSVYFAPMVYVVFVALLPMELSQASVLLAAFALGAVMDWIMGSGGLNTLSLLPAEMARQGMLAALCGRESMREGGIPSPERMGRGHFMQYLAVLVLVQHLLFFLFETLSWHLLGYALLRLIVSGTVSLLFVWLLARLFTVKLAVRQ